jgi:polyhydroxybutyrate depolymerase
LIFPIAWPSRPLPIRNKMRIMTFRNLYFLLICTVAGLVLPALAGFERPAQALLAKITLQSGGVGRTALIIEHERLKKTRRPVVVVLRGGKGPSERARHHIGLGDVARSSGVVMVYPDPIDGKWSDSAGPATEQDAQFILDLVNKLVTEGVADRHRVFITGTAAGGIMAMRLACEHSEIFAGAAVMLAGLPTDLGQTCHPAHPIRFMLIAGTADPFVPFQGGKADLPTSKAELLGAEATLAIFGKAAGCSDTKTSTAFPDRDPKNGTRAVLEKLKGCKMPVELVRIEGGGHTIPGRTGGKPAEVVGPRNNDVDTATLIWEFFRKPSGS